MSDKTNSILASLPRSPEQIKDLAEARVFEQDAEYVRLGTALREVELKAVRDKERVNDSQDYLNGYMVFHGEVDDGTASAASQAIRRFARLYPGKDLTMEINSPGGEITAGLALIDEMLAFRKQAKLTLRVRGEAASMAALLLQAADVREVGPNAHLMLHRSSFGVQGNANQVEDAVETAAMFEAAIYRILGERTGKGAAYWKKTIAKRKDVWYTAEQAVSAGLADAIA